MTEIIRLRTGGENSFRFPYIDVPIRCVSDFNEASSCRWGISDPYKLDYEAKPKVIEVNYGGTSSYCGIAFTGRERDIVRRIWNQTSPLTGLFGNIAMHMNGEEPCGVAQCARVSGSQNDGETISHFFQNYGFAEAANRNLAVFVSKHIPY